MANGVAHLAAFLAGLTAFDLQGDELGGTFAVAHDGLGQQDRHLQHGLAEGGVVGRGRIGDGLALPAWPVAMRM